jgi:hypothetical protein
MAISFHDARGFCHYSLNDAEPLVHPVFNFRNNVGWLARFRTGAADCLLAQAGQARKARGMLWIPPVSRAVAV